MTDKKHPTLQKGARPAKLHKRILRCAFEFVALLGQGSGINSNINLITAAGTPGAPVGNNMNENALADKRKRPRGYPSGLKF